MLDATLNLIVCLELLLIRWDPVDAAELFERDSYVNRYSDAINDLNAALEVEPSLSEAYWSRALVLCHLYEESEKRYRKYLEMKLGNPVVEKELSQLHQTHNALDATNNLFE
ncbi:hypothetical protein L6452_14507 [Arctium lappa]|uniref:Uncharacterized protein n=1 Tax=Arctium lappa TaxID=4217 RepID=A0ACB9CL84_ARCLA|nr:hypothetical protein L6452_14507 [Arctium lappa]